MVLAVLLWLLSLTSLMQGRDALEEAVVAAEVMVMTAAVMMTMERPDAMEGVVAVAVVVAAMAMTMTMVETSRRVIYQGHPPRQQQ